MENLSVEGNAKLSKLPIILFFLGLIISYTIIILMIYNNLSYLGYWYGGNYSITTVRILFFFSFFIFVLFIYMKFFTFKLFKESKRWVLFFYLNYLLVIPFFFFYQLTWGYFAFLLFPAFILSLIISDVRFLEKSYKLKPRLSYFWNIMINLVFILLPISFLILYSLITYSG